MKEFGYPKNEKLKIKKEISLLFEKGKWKSVGKIRIINYKNEQFANQKVGVSVSKRHYKKAVDRNRIKRLLREAYRLNKTQFTEAFGTQSASMLFWVSSEKPAHYKNVETEFLKICEPKNK